MADNITFQTTVATPPNGVVVATDDVASVHFQKVKIDVGGDGATLPLSNSNPLPVSDAGGSLTVDGTVAVSSLPGSTLAGQTAVTADYDTGGGTQNLAMVGVALPGAGGAVAGGTFTNPVRLDPTGTTAQPVTDNGGSLTVDGTVSLTGAVPAGNNNIGDVDIASIAAGDNTIGRMKLTDGTTVVDVFDYTNSNPLAVRLTDTNGDYVGAGAGTQYTEDAAAAANPVGNAVILVRADTPAGVVSADGDNVSQRGTNFGAAYVQVVSSSGAFVDSFGGGTQYTEDVASAADPVGNQLISRRRDTLSGTEVSADGDNIAVNSTSKGELYVKHVDAIPVTDNGGSLTVDGSVSLAAAIPAGTNNIGDIDVLSVPAPLNVTGGGTEASALRVTLANDSTGVVSVDDNGGSLTVDGTVAISGTVTVDSELPTAAALADNASNPTAPAVGAFGMLWDGATWDRAAGNSTDGQLVNLGANNDVTVTSGSITATQATASSLNAQVQGPAAQDAAVSGNPLLSGGRASDATPTAVSADGDAVALWLDRRGTVKTALVDDAGDSAMDGTNNAVRVNIVAGSGSGTEYTEDAAAPANPAGPAVALVRADTPATTTTADGDIVMQRATNYGAAYVQIVSSAGAFVDSFGGGTQYTEDAVSAADPSGNQLMSRRRDTLSGTEVSADGDVIAVNSTSKGELYVKHADAVALAAGTSNIGDVDVLTVPAPLNVTGNGTAASALRVTLANDSTGIVAGAVAHDAAASGNPFQMAGEARSTDRTAVADADVARIITTLLGKQIYVPYAGPAQTWNYAAASGGIVNTTGVTAKTAAGASIRNYVTSIQVINAHASVGTDVQIRDGASGTVLWRGFAQYGGGGASIRCDPPLRGTANTLIEIACGTTGAAVYVNLQGFTATE